MIDSVDKDALMTRGNGRAGPTGGFPLSYNGHLAGCSDVAGPMKSAETLYGFYFYPAVHHTEC